MEYTNKQLAESLDLWREYIDPLIAFNDTEFLALSLQDKLNLIAETYPTK